MAWIEESPPNYWVNKRNKSKICCSSLMCWVDSELSSLMHWLWDSCKQIQSYTLMLKPLLLTPLRFLIYSVYFVKGNCCFHKVPITLVILPNKISLCTHLAHFSTAEILSQTKEMHILAISFFFLQFSEETCPHTLFPFPPFIGDAHDISLFASKWTWELWLTKCNHFLQLMSL